MFYLVYCFIELAGKSEQRIQADAERRGVGAEASHVCVQRESGEAQGRDRWVGGEGETDRERKAREFCLNFLVLCCVKLFKYSM